MTHEGPPGQRGDRATPAPDRLHGPTLRRSVPFQGVQGFAQDRSQPPLAPSVSELIPRDVGESGEVLDHAPAAVAPVSALWSGRVLSRLSAVLRADCGSRA